MATFDVLKLPVPQIPGFPELPTRHSEYKSYFRKALLHRIQMQVDIRKPGNEGKNNRYREFERCNRSNLYCAATYGMIYEVRDVDDEESDMPPEIPWIPYTFQAQMWGFLDWLMTQRGTAGDALIKKARTMGASNTMMFWGGEKWRTRKRFKAHLLSRNQDLVDATGDPDSLFFKVDTYMKHLPRFLWPRGYSPDDKRWRKNEFMKNPVTGGLFTGESTNEEAGRAGRSWYAVLDEWAFFPKGTGAQAWTSMRAATQHRIAISTTETKHGTHMRDLDHGENGYTQPSVLVLPWNAHPLHDDEWFRREKERDTPEGFAREVLLSYDEGRSNWVYPLFQDKEPIPLFYHPIAGPVTVSMDDGFRDHFAKIWIQYNPDTNRHLIFDGHQASGLPTGFHGTLLTGIPNSQWAGHYGKREVELMERQRLIHMTGCVYVGDPHGANVEQTSGMSVFTTLLQDHGIAVLYDMDKRKFKDRRDAVERLMPFMDFSDTPGAREVLVAMQRSRYPNEERRLESTTEEKEPVHDGYSHYRSALEYYAVNWDTLKLVSGGSMAIKYGGNANQG